MVVDCSMCVVQHDGETALYCASRAGYSDVVNILISNGADMEMPTKVSDTNHV